MKKAAVDPVQSKRKKNSRAKGNKKEIQFQDILTEVEWAVERANPKLQFIGPGKARSFAHDFFEVFDLCAIRRRQPTVWVQLTDHSDASKRARKIEEFAAQYLDLSRREPHRVILGSWGPVAGHGRAFLLRGLVAVRPQPVWIRLGVLKLSGKAFHGRGTQVAMRALFGRSERDPTGR
jgi:hypothetical protein